MQQSIPSDHNNTHHTIHRAWLPVLINSYDTVRLLGQVSHWESHRTVTCDEVWQQYLTHLLLFLLHLVQLLQFGALLTLDLAKHFTYCGYKRIELQSDRRLKRIISMTVTWWQDGSSALQSINPFCTFHMIVQSLVCCWTLHSANSPYMTVACK